MLLVTQIARGALAEVRLGWFCEGGAGPTRLGWGQSCCTRVQHNALLLATQPGHARSLGKSVVCRIFASSEGKGRKAMEDIIGPACR